MPIALATTGGPGWVRRIAASSASFHFVTTESACAGVTHGYRKESRVRRANALQALPGVPPPLPKAEGQSTLPSVPRILY